MLTVVPSSSLTPSDRVRFDLGAREVIERWMDEVARDDSIGALGDTESDGARHECVSGYAQTGYMRTDFR